MALGSGILAGKKTYIVAALAVIGAIAAYLTGDANFNDSAKIVVDAVLAATVRHGITTETGK